MRYQLVAYLVEILGKGDCHLAGNHGWCVSPNELLYSRELRAPVNVTNAHFSYLLPYFSAFVNYLLLYNVATQISGV